MNKRPKIFLFAIFLISAVLSLNAQTNESDIENAVSPELEKLLDQSLTSAENGDWEQALQALEDAEKIDPRDPRILSYRTSILELYALDEAQNSWSGGEPAEVENTEPETDSQADEDESPKFVIDRGDRDGGLVPADFRDTLRVDLSLKMFAVNPLSSETVNTWTSANEFFYTSLGLDLRYWMPFLGRSLGFNLRSSGYSWAPGNPDFLFNSLDFGVNLRGFLLESITSRLEIGIDFGLSLHTLNDMDTGIERNGAFFLGLWASDPILFHIFKTDSIERLLFGGGLRIYTSTAEDLLETVNYRLEGSWQFDSANAGVRFEWWDFNIDTGRTIMLSFSLFGGYRY